MNNKNECRRVAENHTPVHPSTVKVFFDEWALVVLTRISKIMTIRVAGIMILSRFK